MKHSLKQLERGIVKLMSEDGDHCTICRAPLRHNSKTYYGAGSDGRATIAGGCCAHTLRHVHFTGFYAAHGGYEFLERRGAADARRLSQPEIYVELAAAAAKYSIRGARPS